MGGVQVKIEGTTYHIQGLYRGSDQLIEYRNALLLIPSAGCQAQVYRGLCTKFHLCEKFVHGNKCLKTECELGHSCESEHNAKLLKCFGKDEKSLVKSLLIPASVSAPATPTKASQKKAKSREGNFKDTCKL